MNLPTLFPVAQKRAQIPCRCLAGFRCAGTHANFHLSAQVPSFNRADGNVTCYPSPSKRPVKFDGGPFFFKGVTRHLEKKWEEARAKCKKSKLSQFLRYSLAACRAVCIVMSNALVLAQPQVRAPRYWSTAALDQRCLRARLRVRFATTLTFADTLNHGAETRHQSDIRTNGANRPAGPFLFAVRPSCALA